MGKCVQYGGSVTGSRLTFTFLQSQYFLQIEVSVHTDLLQEKVSTRYSIHACRLC